MIHTNKWRAKPVAPVLKHMLGAFKCNAIFNATFQQQNGEESTTNNDNKKKHMLVHCAWLWLASSSNNNRKNMRLNYV